MRKKALFLFSLMAILICFVSCGGNQGGTQKPVGEGDQQINEYIYKSDSVLCFVYDPELLSEAQINLVYEKFGDVGVLVQPKSKDSEPGEHELVIGNLGREISDEAYVQLDRIDKNKASDLRFCIYSSGTSLALAYEEDYGGECLRIALDYLLENYVKDELVLKKGVAYKESLDIYDYLAGEDAERFSEYWSEITLALGDDGEEIVEALKALYTIYNGEGLTTWVANLYDPGMCVCKSLYGEETCSGTKFCGTGGFYFSNSARDTVGFLPDIESTLQGLNLINSLGITKGIGGYKDLLPEWMSEQIVNFTYNLQDPDGYFYHPQWGKDIGNSRRGRDSTWSLSILKTYGVTPKYKTALENLGDVDDISAVLPSPLGSSSVVAVSKVVAVEGEAFIPDYLQTTEAFKEYLNSLNIRYNSYGGGSTLSAQGDQILARGPEFGKILIDHLNECQWENGTWNETLGYDAINGVMKISGSYSRWKAPIPNAEKTVLASFASIDTDEKADGIVDVWNAWVAATKVLENIRLYGEGGEAEYRRIRDSLLPSLPEAILATREKLTVFLKKDGSFVYQASGRTSGVSMGQPVAVAGTDEGDLNATLIGSTNMTGYIFSFMGLSNLTVPMALSKERYLFLDTINNLPEIKKAGQILDVGDVIDFEDQDVGDAPVLVTNSGKNPLEIVEDPRNPDEKVLRLVSTTDSGDSMQVKAVGSSKGVLGMVFETDMVINSADARDATFRLEMGAGGDSANSYRITFKFSSTGFEMYDCSANNTSVRVVNSLISIPYGQWFNLRVEVYNGDHDGFRAKVYIDGKLLAVSDNYYDYEGVKLNGKGVPNTKTDLARFYVLKSYKIDVMVDNIICYKNTSEPYKREQLHEDYRYLEGALNVDNFSLEPVIYDMEAIDVGAALPEEYYATEGVSVALTGENKHLLLSDGAQVGFDYTKRAKDVNHSSVSFAMLPGICQAGDGVNISFKDSSNSAAEILKLTVKAVSVGSELFYKLYDASGNEIDGVSVAADEAVVFSVAHFEKLNLAVVFVNGSICASYKTPSAQLNFARATFTALGTVGIDDITVERNYSDVEDMTGPDIEGIIYGFDKLDGNVSVSGNGANISGGKLVLKGTQTETSVTIPVQKRANVIGYTEFGYEVKFATVPTTGDIHLITLTDAEGRALISFTVRKTASGKMCVCETTEKNVYNSMVEFDPKAETALSFCYYENEGICKVYVNGELVLVTSLLYSASSGSLSATSFTLKTLKSGTTAQIDNMYAHRYFKIYVKERPVTTPEDGSETITFDSVGDTYFPSTLTGNSKSVEDGIRIVEMEKNGEYDKVVRYESKSGVGDSFDVRATKKVEGVASSYIFEFDMMVAATTSEKAFQLHYYSDTAQPIRITIGARNNKVRFINKDYITGKEAVIEVANTGEWFNVRVEYYTINEGGTLSSRLKVFINNELLYVTDMSNAAVKSTIDYVNLWCLKDANALAYIDNVRFEESTKTYDGTPVTDGFEAKNAE